MSELIGRKLGKYTLEAQLGEGGMAAVYRSHHPQFNRPVAIKLIPAANAQDPTFRARFEREGRMIAGLNHPSIIRVFDIDEADGMFYMVMELLPGGTLEGRLREGSLDRTWSANLIVRMAEALDYAHAQDVIHRDIKPSNILLNADGAPVLADFGIARLMHPEGDSTLTSAGMIMGTPAYMAPEQLNGEQPDARSDIYALGVVLYQLLAGRAPFTGDTMAIVTGHLTKQPQALRELVRDLPPALDAVVLQALAKQPEHRFKSAGVFAQALRNAAADLEPALVSVASSARTAAALAAAPSDIADAAATRPAAPAATTGQQVAHYLPIVLGVLGLLLIVSIVAKYWALVTLLAILFGGGGFLFIYLRASSQGFKAARETTRTITAAIPRAAEPPPPQLHDSPAIGEPVAMAPQAHDDLPELAQPDTPTQPVTSPVAATSLPAEGAADAADQASSLTPTKPAPANTTHELPPTEAVAIGDLPPTEAIVIDQHPASQEQPPAAEHSR